MLPVLVEKTMNSLCDSLNTSTSNIESIYLYGSVALNDYIEGSSDIDFLAIVKETPTESDIKAILAAHEKVEFEIPNTNMMGAYILQDEIGKNPTAIKPLLTYYNKKLHTNGSGTDINPITWLILQQHGIKIYGSEQSFSYDIEIDSLIKYVINNLNSYWVNWIERLEQQLSSDSLSEQDIDMKQMDEAVEWCTLGMLRQLYTLQEHGITSKTGAGLYGVTQLPEKWYGLIHEAILINQRKPTRYYFSQLERLTDLVSLLKFIHEEANRLSNKFSAY
ncbi:MAG: nucleotidyltransferase domain-containing protein [Candidatus Pristimantibacillus sp.]